MKRCIVLALVSLCMTNADAQQSVIVVRHAELEGGQAMAQPKQLPLSAEGEARAKRLAEILKDANVGAVYVTDFVRTHATAQPTTSLLGKDPVVVPKGDPAELVSRIRQHHAGQNVLLVGHTDTIPGLVRAFGHGAEVKIEAADYGNLFVLTPKESGEPGFLRLRY